MTAGDLDSPLLGRIVRPADYVRVLATPLRLRSPHFAVHHVDGRPLPLKRPPGHEAADPSVPMAGEASSAPVTASLSTDLSTGAVLAPSDSVDDSRGEHLQRWLGLVVPKRHAKRAVTRTLVKRQIRHVVADCAAALEPGLWVVRQRYPFDPKQYPSAASDALKAAARAELRALFERAVRGERDRVKPRTPQTSPGASSRTSSRTPARPPSGGPPCVT